jgi:hypothetical protein
MKDVLLLISGLLILVGGIWAFRNLTASPRRSARPGMALVTLGAALNLCWLLLLIAKEFQ